MHSIDKIQAAWHLAARLHNGQKYGGTQQDEHIEYLNHIGSVVFEVMVACQKEPNLNPDLAVLCAILHDSIEDTGYTYEQALQQFGPEVANGVLALTKNDEIAEKNEKMLDSLARIKVQPKEVWAVKMADRIVNLYAPPFYWSTEKKVAYRQEAQLIYNELQEGSPYLAQRLAQKTADYLIS